MTKKRSSKKAPGWPKKAYKNLDFLTAPEGRIVRVLSEFMEPAARFGKRHVHNTIVFFGSARTLPREEAKGNLKTLERRVAQNERPSRTLLQDYERAKRDLAMSRYYEDAVELAEKLTRWSLGLRDKRKRFLICSGGGGGIMEAANRGAKKAGGTSIGLNISLPMEQSPNRYQSRDLSFEFHYFFIRKFWFFYLAKALVAFPGGFGTMDEMFELLTLVQTRKTKKYMPIIVYGKDYWDRILDFDALVETGTIGEEDLDIFRFFDDVDSAFEYLKKELTKHYVRGTAHQEMPL
jgi:uncharacterized protein (TIGR00730 family)